MVISKIKFAVFLFVIFTAKGMFLPGPSAGMVKVDTSYDNVPIFFIPNEGQVDNQVFYYIQGKDKSVYFTSEGLTFVITEQTGASSGQKRFLRQIEPGATVKDACKKRWAVKIDFVGSRQGVRPESVEQSGTIISYFKGRPQSWYGGLQASSKIIYRDLWHGIDLVFYGTVSRLKYEFVVHPCADPDQIKLAYRGTESVEVTEKGRLKITTPLGVFHDDQPVAWQEVDEKKLDVSIAYALDTDARVKVAGIFQNAANSIALRGEDSKHHAHVYGFTVGTYDRTRTLVLDPALLVYCGYIGGSEEDEAHGVAVDGQGNAYVVGQTESNEVSFPVTVGPDVTFNDGSGDIFVAKVKADGTGLSYCGYLGGTGSFDTGYGISVDSQGQAYIVGITGSDEASFPVTVGPDGSYNGGDCDAFVAKVNSAGTALVYCGYIGGSTYDGGYGIAIDDQGYAYVTGYTSSPADSFPVAIGPDGTYNGGSEDAFVAKVKADGTGLVYCGYIGGSNIDTGRSIAVDSNGRAYVTGTTYSAQDTFPVVAGPDLTFNGDRDAFVARVKADGTGVEYCGYIGSSNEEHGYGIAVDGSGNAYVTGTAYTSQDTFPVIGGPDLTFNGNRDAFVAKVKADGTGLEYCGYIGGDNSDYGYGIAIDNIGNAYITGCTYSTEVTFPVKAGPDLTHNGGGGDAFVSKVNAAGTALVYCGYIGGSGRDTGKGIAFDSKGKAFVAGYTCSSESTFPVKKGPDLSYNDSKDNADAFVAKITEVSILQPVIMLLLLDD